MRKDEIAELYANKVLVRESAEQVVTEGEKVKGQKTTPGKGFEGEEKVSKKMPNTGIDSKGVDVKKPVEAPAKLNPGHESVTEDKEIEDMLPQSSFEMLFKKTLVEEEMYDDESPLEQDTFNDEEGDFPEVGEEEPTEEEEVDVATELRMIIDRLTEVAEKIGAYDEEGPEEDLGGEDEFGGEGDLGMEGEMGEPPVGEAAIATKELKPLPDTVSKMTSKSSYKVKSATSNPESGKAGAGGPGKGSADGKLGSFPDTVSKMTSKGNMKVKTSSRMSQQGKSLFGN